MPYEYPDRCRDPWQTAAMPPEPKSWTIKHFSLASQAGVPTLLRRLADLLDQQPGIEIQDVVLHDEVSADGDWWSATVYFHEPSP
ncbi:hypothetical protein [Micromonospora auratinigra]|uniref:Uncharacterized protein n=1 Tax=Micromonospora auratinigra TaxID=261654 RepID=A0A1A9A663_9ACTN|nr:hypothetical protein [Micromonospora auratinigra]SBT51613.1 hypothetical protein GA0070611_5253 [Micromonospora auratinigra]